MKYPTTKMWLYPTVVPLRARVSVLCSATGMEALFDHTTPIAVDPANLAMRIMDVRGEVAGHYSCSTLHARAPLGVSGKLSHVAVAWGVQIRTVLAKEWIDDLQQVAEDNGQLLKASLLASLELEAPAGVETLTETETLAEMEQVRGRVCVWRERRVCAAGGDARATDQT